MSKNLLKVYIFLSFIALLFIYIIKISFTLDSIILICLVQSLILILLFSSVKIDNLKNKLKYIYIFLIGYIIVFYQSFIDLYLGYKNLNNNLFSIHISILPECILLITFSLNAYVLGYIFLKNEQYKDLKKSKNYNDSIKLNVWPLNIFALLFLVLYYNAVNIEYFLGGYGRFDLSPEAIRYWLFFKIFIFSSFILKFLFYNSLTLKKFIIKFSPELILIILFLVGVITSGDRGPIITFLLLIFLGITKCTNFKIKIFQILILILILSNLMTVLGNARNLDPNLNFFDKIETVLYSKEEASYSILPATQELSGSLNTLTYTMNHINKGNDIFYGKFNLQQFLVSIPFTHRYVNSFLFDDDKKYLSSADYITYIIQGNFPSYGNGSSILADLYLDFGFLFTIVIMFFWGNVSRMIDRVLFTKKINNSHLFVIIFAIFYYSSAVYLSRSTLLLDFQVVVWICLIVYTYIYILKKKII